MKEREQALDRCRGQVLDADCQGQATLEILFVLLLLLLVFFGSTQVARGVILKHALDVGTEKAARVLAINPSGYAAAEDTIRDEVDANLLGGGYGSQVTIRLYDAASMTEITPTDLGNAAFGYRFMVETELLWSPTVPFMSMSDATISVAHQGVVDRIQ